MVPPHVAAFHATPSGSVILERTEPGRFRIVDVNEAARRSAGWQTVSREDVLGRDIAEVFPGVGEAGLLDAYERALSTGEPLDLGCFEYGDAEVPKGVFSIHLEPLDATRLLIWFENVTELDEANRRLQARTKELEDSTRQLADALRELESFSDSLSHDLKNPLVTVTRFAELLSDAAGELLDDRQSDYLRRIHRASLHMTHIIDDLRDLTDVWRREARREEVEMSAMALEIVDELRALVPGRRVRFTVQPDLRGTGDRGLVRILLTNLIQNAWKYTAPRDPATIEIGVEDEPGAERVYFVRDDGIGFAGEDAERIFEPFQRLHSSADFAGSGLGLATASRIVERHGGRIWGDGIPDRGAVFRFTLGPSAGEATATPS